MTGATFLLFINVVLRYAFASGIVWAEEMTRYTLLWTVFVGAGVVTREGTHVSMEAFFNLWPAKLQRIGFLGDQPLLHRDDRGHRLFRHRHGPDGGGDRPGQRSRLPADVDHLRRLPRWEAS